MKKQFTKPAKQAKNLKPKKESAASEEQKPAKTTTRRKKVNALDDITPISASLNESFGADMSRRNKAGSIERTNRFANIDDGLIPIEQFPEGTSDKRLGQIYENIIILIRGIVAEFMLTYIHPRWLTQYT